MTDDFKKATQVTEVVEIESEGSSKVDYDIMRSEDSENDEPDTDWENEQLKPNFLLSKPIQEPVITLDSESEINDNPDVEYVKLNFDTSDDEEIKIECTKIKPKFVDFSSFPSSFKSSEKALEKYNELGILHNLYFVIKDSNKGTKNHFELKCHIQNCNVIVKFNYDEETEHYRRIEGYNIIHSHFLEKFEIYSFDQATTEEVNRAYLEDPTIKAVEFSKTLSNIINRKVEPFEGLLILNKIKEKYRVDYSMLALDCQTIQNYDNEAYIVINKGDLTVMFLQTKFMAEHLQHNAYSILVSVSKDKCNKYGFYTILFSSITIFGQTVSCGLGFMNIKCVDSYSWVFAKFLEKASTLLNGKYPPVIIVPFEGDVIAASLNTFGDVSKIYCNHFYIMNTVKSLLSPFILKSDGMAKEVYHLSHRILSEQNEKKWLLLEEKIVENLGFDKNIEKWYEKFFFDQKEFWKMTTKDEMFYTGGLHTSYRAELVEKHFFSHLKQSSGFYDMLKQLIKVQYYDFSLEIKESETVRIKTHPVYVAVKRSFTKYGVSFMTKKIIKSFNHDIEVIEEETKYKIKEKNSIGGRSFKVKKEKSRIRNGNFTNIEITLFSVLQVKTVQYFDYVPYWREDASLKKKKIKRDRKRFCASVVAFRHEKRLKSFIEFIGSKMRKKGKDFVKNGGKSQGKSSGIDEKTRKEMKNKYHENRERVRQEFGLKKKVEMYVEQAQRDVAEANRLKISKNNKSKDIFDMKDIEKRQKKKQNQKRQLASSSSSSSSRSDNSSSGSSRSSSDSESNESTKECSKTKIKKQDKFANLKESSNTSIEIEQVKLFEVDQAKKKKEEKANKNKPEKKREKKENRKGFKNSSSGVFG